MLHLRSYLVVLQPGAAAVLSAELERLHLDARFPEFSAVVTRALANLGDEPLLVARLSVEAAQWLRAHELVANVVEDGVVTGTAGGGTRGGVGRTSVAYSVPYSLDRDRKSVV